MAAAHPPATERTLAYLAADRRLVSLNHDLQFLAKERGGIIHFQMNSEERKNKNLGVAVVVEKKRQGETGIPIAGSGGTQRRRLLGEDSMLLAVPPAPASPRTPPPPPAPPLRPGAAALQPAPPAQRRGGLGGAAAG